MEPVMGPGLGRRAWAEELMDSPDVDPEQLQDALAWLELINRWLGGWRTSLRAIKPIIEQVQNSGSNPVPWTMLDVGCGSGDLISALHASIPSGSLPLIYHGLDKNQGCLEAGRRRVAALSLRLSGVHWDSRDLFELSPDGDQVDIVHGALVLHHTASERKTLDFLRQVRKLARRAVIINDLHRHSFAYGAIWILTRLLSRNPVLQHDAPMSVRRGFTKLELMDLASKAGWEPHQTKVTWHWAFRWCLIWSGELCNSHPRIPDGQR